MVTTPNSVKVRPLVYQDIEAITTIDRLIRDAGQAITYAKLTTADVLIGDKKPRIFGKSASMYLDLAIGHSPGKGGIGLVAEINGDVRGFIIGQIKTHRTRTASVGRILIVGVHPDFQSKGIATLLLNELCQRFRARNVREIETEVDVHDKSLLDFLRANGFSTPEALTLTKDLYAEAE